MINHPLLESVDELEIKNHHSMVLYKDPQYGAMVKNRFIENGLKKGESVICVTHEDVSLVEDEMKLSGIDVEHFKEKNQLHIHQIENLIEDIPGKTEEYKKLLEKITEDTKPPFRIVGRCIKDISSEKGVEAQLAIESLVHSHFENFKNSILCVYPVYDIEKNKRPLWLSKLITNHHNLIFATEPLKSVIFEPDLLKSI